MSAANVPLAIEQNVTFRMRMQIKLAGVLADLTLHQFVGQIRKTATATDLLASFSFEKSLQANDTLGEVYAVLEGSQSLALPIVPNKTPVKVSTPFAYDIVSYLPQQGAATATAALGANLFTGLTNASGLAVGSVVTSPDIPSPTPIMVTAIDPVLSTVQLSVNSPVAGPVTLNYQALPREYRWLEGIANVSPTVTR